MRRQTTRGADLHQFAEELFPLCRSITGEGLRETLRRLATRIPITIHEVRSGTKVLDWEVPDEWTIRAARIERLDGSPVVDFAWSNLHVVSYSEPVDAVMSRVELAPHIHTLPAQPDLIPYRTAYYARTWGFCLPHRTWESMTDEAYRVVIDASLAPGALSYGELLIEGQAREEVLISVHCCHPSLANDNLSGIVVAAELARQWMQSAPRLSCRFLFIPGTIGSLTWLSRNEALLPMIRHGLVLTCLGDRGSFHYKRSRRENATIDRAVPHVLRQRGLAHTVLPFTPFGYDERQYCSPAYDLPVGCLMRSPNGTFPEYHTSADDLSFITASNLGEAVDILLDVLSVLDRNVFLERVDGRGEPQLGRRGLYQAIGGQAGSGGLSQAALLWTLNLADGRHALMDIAERADLPFEDIARAAELAREAGLLRDISTPAR
jgi:aminopeptidase-like protein